MSRAFLFAFPAMLCLTLLVSLHPVPAEAQLQAVDPNDRASVVSFWDNVYQASEGVASGWNGNIGTCTPGTLSSDYLDAGVLRIQYFRAMVGLPTNITLDTGLNGKCQASAVMMSANNAISHSPPVSWDCYTADGSEAAAKSNLAIGFSSLPGALTALLLDNGINSVGHRRWMLFPPQGVMGIGATFGGGSPGAYVNWVFGGPGGFEPRPVSPEWVAWPPNGYVPYQLVPSFWSFSYHQADFSGATVTMTQGGGSSPPSVTVAQEALQPNFGDNTLVWTPQGLPGGAPNPDRIYDVTISNVMISGSPQSFSYRVTVIDPTVMVPAQPATWGSLKYQYQDDQ